MRVLYMMIGNHQLYGITNFCKRANNLMGLLANSFSVRDITVLVALDELSINKFYPHGHPNRPLFLNGRRMIMDSEDITEYNNRSPREQRLGFLFGPVQRRLMQ